MSTTIFMLRLIVKLVRDVENNIVYKVEDFLKDNNFINYVFGNSVENEQKWKDLCEGKSEFSTIAKEAMDILLASSEVECGFSLFERSALKKRILKDIGA